MSMLTTLLSGIGPVTESQLSFSDVTTGNATTSAHGLSPKLPGNTTTFYRGDGNFAAAGSSSPLTTKGDLYGYNSADARIPVGANYKVVMADSTTALGLAYNFPALEPSTITKIIRDFTSGNNGDYSVAGGFSGTGANGADINTLDTTGKHKGIRMLSTGTTNTGYAYVCNNTNTSNGKCLYLGNSINIIEAEVYFTQVSDGTDTYEFTFGCQDATGAVPGNNGVWLSYTHSANSGKWVLKANKAAAGVQTANTTSAIVAGATWYKIKLVITNTTSVEAFVGAEGSDYSSVGTLTTALPVVALFPWHAIIIKSAGTTNVDCGIDFTSEATIYNALR